MKCLCDVKKTPCFWSICHIAQVVELRHPKELEKKVPSSNFDYILTTNVCL